MWEISSSCLLQTSKSFASQSTHMKHTIVILIAFLGGACAAESAEPLDCSCDTLSDQPYTVSYCVPQTGGDCIDVADDERSDWRDVPTLFQSVCTTKTLQTCEGNVYTVVCGDIETMFSVEAETNEDGAAQCALTRKE